MMKGFKLFKIGLFSLLIAFPSTFLGQELNKRKIDGNEPSSAKYSSEYKENYNKILKQRAIKHNQSRKSSLVSSRIDNPLGTCNVITCGSFNSEDTDPDTDWGGIMTAVDGTTYAANVEYDCWNDVGTVDYSEGQYISYSNSDAYIDTPAIISPSPDGGGFSIFSYRNEAINQTLTVHPNTVYTACFEIAVIPRYSNDDGSFVEFIPNLQFGINSGGVQITDPLTYTHNDLTIQPLSVFPTQLSTNPTGPFQNSGDGTTGWTEINPYWETVCITFESDATGSVNVFYQTGNPGRSVVLVDGLRLALEGYANSPELTVNSIVTNNGTDTFCDDNFSVDLNDYVTSTSPSGSILTWTTNSDLLDTDDHLTNTTVTTPGVYYVFYYNSVDACASPAAVLTIEVSDLTAQIDSTSNINCLGESDGSFTVSATGGSSPYSFSLDNVDFSNSSGVFNNLTSGTYTTYVKDANDCTDSVDVLIGVLDNENPTASNPNPIIVECSVDVPSPNIDVVTDESDDSTANPTVEFVSDSSDGNTCPEIITRIYSVADDCGNSINVTQIITIQDTTAPTFNGTLPDVAISAECDAVPTAETLTADDNCGNAVVTFNETRVDGSCASSYVLTRTWTATDECGLTTEFVQTVTVEDTTAPTFNGTLPDVAISAECDAVPTVETLTADDNCGNAVVTFNETRVDGSCASSYVLTRTWTATDECGLTTEFVQTVTVEDTTAPTFNGTLPDVAISAECDAVPTVETLTADDNCGNAVVTFNETRVDGSCASSYVLTRTWTATDECGLTTEFVQTVTIEDTTAPTFNGTLPDVAISAECDAVPTAETLTADDNCGNAVVTFNETRVDGSCASSYVLTRTWTATDECGLTTEFVQTVTVEDTTAPTFNGTLPDVAISAECDAVPTVETLTADDNCGNAVVTFNETRVDGSCASSYVLTRTWTATDECGLTTEFVQTVTVEDTTAPTFNGTLPDVAISAECDAVPTVETLTADDNCGNAVVTFNETRVDGSCASSYVLTRTWTATDECGLTTEFVQTVTVEDTTAPTFNGTLPDVAISAECDAVPTVETLTADDNCGNAVVTFNETRVDGSCASSYVLTRTWTATDECGLTTEFVQTVTVEDTTAPTFNGTLPDVAISAECDAVPTVETLTADDNCGNAVVTFNETRVDGSCASSYVLTRTWTATDECGLTTEFVQTVTVEDTTAPTFNGTLPDVAISAECDAVPTVETLTADDNCGNAVVTFNETRVDGSCASSYVLTRTWTATDECGLTTEFVQTVTVEDTTAPTFNGTLPDVAISAECDAVPTVETLTADDNCGNAVVTFNETRVDGSCASSYVLTRTWTATDECGLTTEFVQTVTVEDTTAPTFNGTLPDVAISAECDAVPTVETLTADDNCGNAVVTFNETRVDGSCASSYVLTRTWTATDECGLTTEFVQTVTVEDTTAPVISVEASNIAIDCGSGSADAIQNWLDANGNAEASDNCGTITWTNNYNGATSDCSAPVEVVFTAIDECGNMSTTAATFSIEDTIPPVIDVDASNLTVQCDGLGNDMGLQNWLTSNGGASASDDCSAVTWTNNFTNLSDDCGSTGSAIVEFTATDGCGNTSITIATFTIEDTTAPTFNGTLPDVAISAECDAVPTVETLTADDNCGNAVVTFNETRVDGSCASSYVLTRTWTATDECGLTTEFVQTVTVEDTTAPTFNGTLPDVAISAECDAVPTVETLTADDNCGNAVVTFNETRVDGSCASSYVLTRTWTATDECGLTTEFVQTVTVEDTTAPTFNGTLPDVAISAECDAVPTVETLTADDNCGNAVVTFNETRVDGSCASSYVLTRTWTATDECGLTTEFVQTVTVEDTTAPTFNGTLPDVAISAECDAVPTVETLTADDNCGNAVVTFNETRVDGSCASSYVLTRTWTATDECGLTTEFVQTVTVEDTTAPTFNGTLPDVAISAECDAVPTVETLTADDNCGNAVVTFNETRVDGSCASSYVLTRTWTATDECGLTTEFVQTVTVEDTTAPTFNGTLPDVAISAECDAVPTVETLTADDNCGNAVVTFNETRVDGSCASSYVLTRTWTATDECGLTTEFVQTVTVEDTTAPTFNGTLPDVAISAECDAVPTVETLTADDNCGNAVVTFNETRVDGSCASSYVLTRTWTATDECGLTTEFVQTVTVEDTTAPTFNGTLPDVAISAECDAVPTVETLTADDNCGNAVVTFNETRVDGSCASSYVLTRTWTATDECGLTTEFVQTVTVEDTTAPTFNGTLPDVAISAECDAVPTVETLTADDNCGNAVVTFNETRVDGSCASSYVLTRTWTATDECGLTTEFVQTVTVEDTTAPTFNGTLPDVAISAECDAVPTVETLTADDNCGNAVVTFNETRVDGSCASSYVLTRTWTATDECGLTTEFVQTVTVEDTTAPTFNGTLPDVAISAECDAVPTVETLTADDNCGNAVVTFNETRVDGSCASSYVLTRTWTATDECGLTTEFVQTVTVEDTTAPTFNGTLPDVAISAECDAVPTVETLTADDNCGNAVVTFNETRVDGSCASSYVLTRTWTATDECGLTTEFVQTVTVEDTTAPTFNGTLPDVAISAECDAVPTVETLTADDNCGNAVVTFNETRVDGSCASSYVLTRTWTATDECGLTTEFVQTVTVEDTTAPTFNGTLPDVAISAECDAVPTVETLTADDNCGNAVVTFNETRVDGSCASSYVLTRTWTATDECGLTTEFVQTVTVEDTTAPTFNGTLPDVAISAECDAVPTVETLTADDNCGNAVVTFNETRVDGSCASSYVLTRTWTATDECGLTTEFVQTVTVEDTTAPTFNGTLPDVAISAECDAVPTAETLTADDNCGNAVVTFNETRVDGSCASSYVLTRTWTATDECGLTTEFVQTVTVEDTTAPELSDLPDTEITVTCGDVPEVPEITATDNCDDDVQLDYQESSTDPDEDGNYIITRNWIFSDACGNETPFEQIVNVESIDITTSVPSVDICIEDISIDLSSYLVGLTDDNGIWTDDNTSGGLSGDDFDPSIVNIGSYQFTYTSSDETCNTVVTLIINVNDDCVVLPCTADDIENEIKISKAVTPNVDGFNDFFEVTGLEDCGFVYEVQIFNRWGKMVHESPNYQNNWGGTVIDGMTIGTSDELPSGTYYYVIKIVDGGIKPITGYIYLGRN